MPKFKSVAAAVAASVAQLDLRDNGNLPKFCAVNVWGAGSIKWGYSKVSAEAAMAEAASPEFDKHFGAPVSKVLRSQRKVVVNGVTHVRYA